MNEYGIVYENVDLKKYTTLGVGGITKYLIEVTSENNLVSLRHLYTSESRLWLSYNIFENIFILFI